MSFSESPRFFGVGRGSCGQARKWAAALRFVLTVTAPLSVAGRGRGDEGRSGTISTACGAYLAS